ncbi:MAG TPA: hypothetical protein DCL21_07440 [Alphaproteobacteria bacterium]|nr:hypothetical protein [Alphaproteobacteria bacterium]
MFKVPEKYIGWVQGLFTVLVLWGGSNVYMSYVTQTLNVNKLVFAFVTFITCSFCLLIYAKDGKLSKETFRSIDTWVYGIIMIVGYFVALNLFGLMSATEATILRKVSVIFGVIVGYVFLMRGINKTQALGLVVISSGVLLVAYNIEPEKAFKAYILIFLAGFLQTLRMFVAEYHRPHKKATEDKDIKSRCRVIGYVMFIVSILFLFIITILSLLASSAPNSHDLVKYLITIDDFMNYRTILSGIVMGIFMYAPLRFFEFSVTEKIKTENFLALGALTFVATLFWEWSTAILTGLTLRNVTTPVIIAGILITLGSLIMSISKIRSARKTSKDLDFLVKSSQNIDDVEETRDIVANTLENFNSDVKKTANALGISVKSLKAVLEDKEKLLAFKPEVLRSVAKSYRKNVASADALTGLLNRNAFITSLKTAKLEYEILSLLFIDLNKFKPVNDTYGHEAGDFVLQIVADRLRDLFPDKSLITRLGGDEYCILLLGIEKKQAEDKIELITQELEREINYQNNAINISGSIGLASYPVDTDNAEDLIQLADKQMYVKKGNR